jgi:hypothetical protein
MGEDVKASPIFHAERRTHALPLSPEFNAELIRWSLMLVLFVGAMVPWYTLRLLPIVIVGTAKVNLLDAVAACAVLLALPIMLQAILRGPRELLWPCAFMAYMAIPLAVGLHDHEATFLAIREARALPFYSLAIAFVAGNYGSRDFRWFIGTYVTGAALASIAVFAHVRWLVPLPGYPDTLPTPNQLGDVFFQVRYLEWTVPLVAFTMGVAGALTADGLKAKLRWAGASLLMAWHILAMAERFMQALALGSALVLMGQSFRRETRTRQGILLGVAFACIAALAVSIYVGPGWLKGPIKATMYRWSVSLGDSGNSLGFRIEELRGGLPRLAHHWLFGIGLGGLVLNNDPLNLGHPWRYVSTGYGFLLIKTGIVGLILYAGMATSALRLAWRRSRRDLVTADRNTLLLGTAGLGVLLLFNLMYPAVDTPEGAMAFSLFFAMLVTRRP